MGRCSSSRRCGPQSPPRGPLARRSLFRGVGAFLLLATSLLAGASGIQKAPPGLYAFRSFGVSAGLTNPSTTALVQDRDGSLWVGTEDGLFRLDGDRFRRFGEDEGLLSATILDNGLSAGLTHGLWVSTNRGPVFWNGRRFERPSQLGAKGPSAPAAKELDELKGMNLAQGGLLLSDPRQQRRFLSLDGEAFAPLDALPWGEGLAAGTYLREREELYLCFRQTLWVRGKEGSWRQRSLAAGLGQDIRAIWVEPGGGIWLRSLERLVRLAGFEAPVERIALPAPLSAVNFVSLGVDGAGRLWTNSAQGLIWVKGEASGFLGSNDGLPQGGARVLRVDGQGTVWIAGEGVHKLLGGGLWTGYTRRQGLPAEVVWSIARTRDGQLWAGTSAGLAPWDGRRWATLPRTQSNWFLVLEEDDEGNLWTGHTPSSERPTGLSVRPPGSSELKPVPVPGLPARAWVRALRAEGRTLWLGTPSTGLFRATREGLHLEVEPVSIGSWPRETSINQIALDGRGGLWVASSRGLAHGDGRHWVTLDQGAGLLEDSVLLVAAQPDGEAWISYADRKGLTRVRLRGEKLEVVQTMGPNHPLVRYPISTMAARPGGELWLGSSSGLLRWDGQRVEVFGRATGLPGDDCAQNALWFDPNGDVWVGLSVGMARGRLGRYSGPSGVAPSRVFVATRGDGQSLLGDGDPRRVPWAARTLTFQYGTQGSVGTEGLSYEVRLVGSEDDWRGTALPEARYPGLGPGTYRFEVRAVNGVGELGRTGSLEVRILPPWWLTWWFRLLAATAFLGLVLLGHWLRLRSLQRRNVELQAQVQARTQDLESALAALRSTLNRFEKLVENVPLGMIDWDPELQVQAWNPAAERIFGYSAEELRGRKAEELLFPDRPMEAVRTSLVQHRDPSRQHYGSGPCMTKEGRVIQCEWVNTPIRDPDGRLIGITSLVEDVTQKRRMEETLRLTLKLESLATVAGGIAHDFNNLLTAISGSAELAMKRGRDPRLSSHLQRILDTSQRAALLAGQMLVYAGRASVSLQSLDLNALLRQFEASLEAKMRPGLRLDLRLESRPAWVIADRTQIEQALECLVANAVEASGEKEGVVRLSLGLEEVGEAELARLLPTLAFQTGPSAVITVSDEGCGMDRATLDRIFDPFFSTKFQGRGMGLSMLLGSLRSHRAGLSVQSQLGRGSTFRLYFQIAEPAVERESLAPAQQEDASSGAILFVDDEPVLRELAEEALASLGRPILLAKDGLEAVEICRARPDIRLVISDLMMPRMGGLEACTLIRQQNPGIRVMLCSGYTEDNLDDGVGKRFEAFLQKPYRLQQLLEVAERLLA